MQELTIGKSHAFRRDILDAGIERHTHARALHFRLGKVAQAGRDLRQQLIARMHHGDREVFIGDVVKKTMRAPQQIVDFTRHFHATEAAPDDNEREIVTLKCIVITHLCFFQQLHDMKPQRNGIANGFEGQGVIGHTRHGAEIDS